MFNSVENKNCSNFLYPPKFLTCYARDFLVKEDLEQNGYKLREILPDGVSIYEKRIA